MHGGSYAAADADPKGPRLFLIEQDDAYLARLERSAAAESESESSSQQSAPPPPPQQKQAPQVKASAIPQNTPQSRPGSHYNNADEVERRYRELLREYGIE